jgi:hypothetical protein
MSATEIIRQIEDLPPEEQQKVFAYVQEHIGSLAAIPQEPSVSNEFKEIADDVLTKNAELFRKLAQ